MANVAIVSHGIKGRGLHTTKDLKEKEILFLEDPLVSCQFAWNQDLKYAACDHCLRPLETPEENAKRLCQIPELQLPSDPAVIIPELSNVRRITCECLANYCSLECQEKAFQQYHRALCTPPDSAVSRELKCLKEIWKKMHYPPETATVMILLRIYALIHQAEDRCVLLAKFQQFVSDASNPAICEKLLGKFHTNVNQLRESIGKCVELLQLNVPREILSPEGFLTTLSILALNSQGIGTSAFALWVDQVTKEDPSNLQTFIDSLYAQMEEAVGLEFLDNEGSGLYELQSKINHSCEPNAQVIFPEGNHKLAIRSLRDISKDEEITISYLDECELNRSRHSRQKLLREKYLFSCICHKCEAQVSDPDETSEEEDDDEEMES